MIQYATLLTHTRARDITLTPRYRHWKRALAAMGITLTPQSFGHHLQQKYPETARVIETYMSARERCNSDEQRYEARARILDPHCAALATRSLAEMRGPRQTSSAASQDWKQRRIARLKAATGRRGA